VVKPLARADIIAKDSPGERVLLLGNEAVARGAIEAEVQVATSYPGTPASEILETIASVADKFGIHAEWSVNEMVAFETAAGAAIAGLRAMTSMKHVGMNWIMDPLMTVNQSGVRGGFVVVAADDPAAYSSQNEQDSRYYSKMAELLMLEPSDAAEAKEAIIKAFDISERLELPVLVRLVNRICHSRADVTLGPIKREKRKGMFIRDRRWVMIAGSSRERHAWLHQRQREIQNIAQESMLNRLEGEGNELGIIAAGVTYTYVKDALRYLGLDEKVSILKIGTYPLPRNLVLQLLDRVKTVLVFEEVEPIVEEQVKVIAFDGGKTCTIRGKLTGDVQREGGLDVDAVASSIAHVMGIKYEPWTPEEEAVVEETIKIAPPRRLLMCPGCPHIATFFVINQAARRATRGKIIYSGDIGCYSLGFYAFEPPRQDTQFCMGASIGVGCGLAHSGVEDVVVATIGDSTFIHAGIPPLINAVYNNARMVVVIFDNGTTAMTGHQPHPGTGVTATGSQTRKLNIEDIVKACGVEYVKVIDPYNIAESIDTVVEAMRYPGLSVIISRRQCILEWLRRSRREGVKIEPYSVDPEKCKGCKLCINEFGCPAITFQKENNVAVIDKVLCNGCGVCVQVCPSKAIHKGGA
jgi:indolepyruvate ferredoxin oxidoreductase alpha subunit